jgi:hypothetical protein
MDPTEIEVIIEVVMDEDTDDSKIKVLCWKPSHFTNG